MRYKWIKVLVSNKPQCYISEGVEINVWFHMYQQTCNNNYYYYGHKWLMFETSVVQYIYNGQITLSTPLIKPKFGIEFGNWEQIS